MKIAALLLIPFLCSCPSTGSPVIPAPVIEEVAFWAGEMGILAEEAEAAGYVEVAGDLRKFEEFLTQAHGALVIVSKDDMRALLLKLPLLADALAERYVDDPDKRERIRLIAYGVGLTLRRYSR